MTLQFHLEISLHFRVHQNVFSNTSDSVRTTLVSIEFQTVIICKNCTNQDIKTADIYIESLGDNLELLLLLNAVLQEKSLFPSLSAHEPQILSSAFL